MLSVSISTRRVTCKQNQAYQMGPSIGPTTTSNTENIMISIISTTFKTQRTPDPHLLPLLMGKEHLFDGARANRQRGRSEDPKEDARRHDCAVGLAEAGTEDACGGDERGDEVHCAPTDTFCDGRPHQGHDTKEYYRDGAAGHAQSSSLSECFSGDTHAMYAVLVIEMWKSAMKSAKPGIGMAT